MSLPDELVDHILGFLRSDLVTLEKCAQSHPFLSKFVERYIYAEITLHDDICVVNAGGLTWRTSKFTKIIAKNPNITNHVRSLKIYVNNDIDPEQRKATTSHLNKIASMLPTFSRLKKITLRGFGPRSHISWHTLPKMFCQAFHLLHVRFMEDVSIFYVSFFPLLLFNHCQTVRATLHNCTHVQYDNAYGLEDHPYRRPLQHLSIRCCWNLKKITSWVQTQGLRSLRVTLDEYESKHFLPRLLSACSSTLINLELDIEMDFQTLYRISPDSGVESQGGHILFPFTLAGLPYIERLTISMGCTLQPQERITYGWDHHSPTPAITGLVSTAPNLKQIFLDIMLMLRTRELPDPDAIWTPFIPLVEKCAFLSITLTVSVCANFTILGGKEVERLPCSEISSSLSGCGGLQPYVERGVFILMPEIDSE